MTNMQAANKEFNQKMSEVQSRIREKRINLKRLSNKETEIEKKIQKNLERIIIGENKRVAKARKTKDKTRAELLQKLGELKGLLPLSDKQALVKSLKHFVPFYQ